MAEIKSVADVIESGLNEIGLDGKLEVEAEGEHVERVFGVDRGNDVEVVVTVREVPHVAD